MKKTLSVECHATMSPPLVMSTATTLPDGLHYVEDLNSLAEVNAGMVLMMYAMWPGFSDLLKPEAESKTQQLLIEANPSGVDQSLFLKALAVASGHVKDVDLS